MSDVIIRGMEMIECCAECPMLDDMGDYPMCMKTRETCGYGFPVNNSRMSKCPLEPYPNTCIKTMTNGDRIRNMTDEQLAVFIAEITDCMFCVAETPIGDEIDGYIRCGNNCEQTILRYLQQEAET